MNHLSFSLQPFPKANPLPTLEITGSIARNFNTLAIRYVLLGHLAEIVTPPAQSLPARKTGLWEETCLEFFLAVRDCPRYWEFNLSPAGDWNVYRFAAYREGMQEETAFASLPLEVVNQSDSLVLALELTLDSILPTDQKLEVAISAVIKHRNGELSYWALTHRGPQVDFHRRAGFILKL
jgi:hypothetical protein